jgi:hypothetical protein
MRNQIKDCIAKQPVFDEQNPIFRSEKQPPEVPVFQG